MNRSAAAGISTTAEVEPSSSREAWEGSVPALLSWFVLHALLGAAIPDHSWAATSYGTCVIGVGVWTALRRPPHASLYVAAYIAGADILWRMGGAQLPWEAGKYSIVLILGIALLRRRDWYRLPASPVLYFVVLLPSTLQTLVHPAVPEADEAISFNMSGPLSLAVTATFCAAIRFTPRQITRAMLSAMGPLFSIATITILTTYFGGPIDFGSESNMATSGGYGPNQVSALLGLGALLAYLIVIGRRVSWSNRVMATVLFGVFVVQSAMTFSRGGLYAAGGAAFAGGLIWLRDARARLRLVIGGIVVTVVSVLFVLPQLGELTGGALQERFRDTGTTGRMELMLEDLELAARHPVFGVGPGVAAYERHDEPKAAHTEITRLLAEHGVLGVVAILLLVSAGFRAIGSTEAPKDTALVLTLLVWSGLTMLHAAMRFAATGFIFGFAFAVAGATGTVIRRHRSAEIPPVQQQPSNGMASSR